MSDRVISMLVATAVVCGHATSAWSDTVADGFTLAGGKRVILNGGGMYNLNFGCVGCGPEIPQSTPRTGPQPGLRTSPEGLPNLSDTGGPAPSPPTRKIVAYTWDPVPEAADRLVYAIKVDRRQYDVQEVAAQLEQMPPGHRAIRLWKWADPELTRHPADACQGPDGSPTEYWYPQPEAGLRVVRSRWEGFLEQLRQTGAPLDEVILDFEKSYSMWLMSDGHPAAIMADPRWKGIISLEAGELKDISDILDFRYHDDYLVWNAATRRIVDRALQQAIYEPLRHRYPGSRCSNYDSFRMQRQYLVPTVTGAHPQWYESDGFGTHEGAVAYGTIGIKTDRRIRRKNKPLGMSPYAACLFTVKRVEAIEASSTRPLKVWVCSRNKATRTSRPVRGTPYNDEILRHMLVRRHGLLLWNAGMGDNEQEMMQTNAIIAETAAMIGETGSALPYVTDWPNSIVHSSATGPHGVVHRFTLEFPDKPLRYRLGGRTHAKFPEPGEVGLWVTHQPDDKFKLLGKERHRFVVEGFWD
jgi:hypothetical protein